MIHSRGNLEEAHLDLGPSHGKLLVIQSILAEMDISDAVSLDRLDLGSDIRSKDDTPK